MLIRDAIEADLPMILEIYNEVIANTTAVYREDPSTLEDRRAWWLDRLGHDYPVLVAADGAEVAGFGSFGDFRPWPCYRHTVEHSVHVRADRRGRGVGKLLVRALMPRAAALSKHAMIAGVDADNGASITMHEGLGFTRVAHLREVGRKFGRWLDLVFLEKILDQAGLSRGPD